MALSCPIIMGMTQDEFDGNTCDIVSDCVEEVRNSRKISHLDNSKKNNNQMSNRQG